MELNERPNDLPRDELLDRAREAIAQFDAQGTPAFVNFKFTCEKCGTRCSLSEPNTLYENGECCVCGHTTKIIAGGFSLTINLASHQVKGGKETE
jgi:hypothetical protein